MSDSLINTIVEVLVLILGSTVISALVNGFFNMTKWNTGEKSQSQSASALNIAEATNILLEPLTKRIEEVESKNRTLNSDFLVLRKEYARLERELTIMRNWAERLANQVVLLGGIPVGVNRPEEGLIIDIDEGNE